MKYTITIQELHEVPDQKYPSSETVYEQTIEATTEQVIKDVVGVVNNLVPYLL